MRGVTRALVVTGMFMVGTGVCAAQEQEQQGARGRERGREQGRREPRQGREAPEGRAWGRFMFRLPDETREFVEQFYPGRLEELERLRRTDLGRLRQEIAAIMREKRELDELKEADPEAYERRRDQAQLERQAAELAGKIREAEGQDAKNAAKQRLTEVVSRLFDIQCENVDREVQELNEHVQRMRELLEKRRAAKEKIVERRVGEMSGESEHLHWDAPEVLPREHREEPEQQGLRLELMRPGLQRP